MLARPVLVPFDSPDHLFEPRWGGLRALAFVEHGRTRIVDRRGRDVGSSFPELGLLASLLEEEPAVLDGEIVIAGPNGLADGLPLDERLAGRSAAGSATYLAFDLLVSARRSLLGEPLERRRDLLRRLLRRGTQALLVPAVRGDGIALHRAVSEQGLHGTVGRHRRGPYLPGVRSDLWRFVETAEPIVGPTSTTATGSGSPAPGADDEWGPGPIIGVLSRLPLGDADEPPDHARPEGA
jgi:bifunctional non-homologous end joining protein LigD